MKMKFEKLKYCEGCGDELYTDSDVYCQRCKKELNIPYGNKNNKKIKEKNKNENKNNRNNY